MPRQLISSGSAFEKVAGYSRAVVDGDWIFVSGTTGFDYAKMSISDDVIEMAVDRLTQAPPGAVIGLSHYMHGAVCRVAPDATAFSLRQSGGIHLRIGLGWDDSNIGERLMAWADTSTRLLRAAQGERIYANYQTYEGPGSAEAVFAGNHPRLVTVKKQYDPTNTFHRNSNIQPRAAY